MTKDYWLEQAENLQASSYTNSRDAQSIRLDEPSKKGVEYIHMQLWDGESVRFKRVWSGYCFTDREVEMLKAGMEIRIDTPWARGIIGSLEWQTYNGYDYYGFSPWDASAYLRENAPFPIEWNGHTFTDDEMYRLRSGQRLLLMLTSKSSGNPYGVHVSFDLTTHHKTGEPKWGIVPHFEEFNQPASAFTLATAPFLPMFSGKRLTPADVDVLRTGAGLPFEAVARNGKPYRCRLFLRIENNRWRLAPDFG